VLSAFEFEFDIIVIIIVVVTIITVREVLNGDNTVIIETLRDGRRRRR